MVKMFNLVTYITNIIILLSFYQENHSVLGKDKRNTLAKYDEDF